MTKWQLQQAKNQFSEVVRKARQEGPQVITLHGQEAAVVIAVDDYRRMAHRPQDSLVDFFRHSPLAGIGLDLTRNPDLGRDIEL